CLGRRMALLRFDLSKIVPRYFLYYYLSPEFQRTIDEHTLHGATVNRIGLATMGKWPIQIHSLREQNAIAEVLGALDDKIAANEKAVSLSAKLTKARYLQAARDGVSEQIIGLSELVTRG